MSPLSGSQTAMEAGPRGKHAAPGMVISRSTCLFLFILEKSVPGLQGDPAFPLYLGEICSGLQRDPASEIGAQGSSLILAARSFQSLLLAVVGKMLAFHSPDMGGWQCLLIGLVSRVPSGS